MIWTILAIVALAGPTLYRAWLGWRDGAATEMRIVIVALFAVLLALHFWKPATDFLVGALPTNPRFLALAAFTGLTAIGVAAAGFAVRLKGYSFFEKKSNRVDQLLGVAAGLVSGALIGSTFALVLVIALPVYFADPEKPDMAQKIGVWPMRLCREVERLVGVPTGSAARTKFPAIQFEQREIEPDDDAPEAEAGMRMVVREPVVVWR